MARDEMSSEVAALLAATGELVVDGRLLTRKDLPHDKAPAAAPAKATKAAKTADKEGSSDVSDHD